MNRRISIRAETSGFMFHSHEFNNMKIDRVKTGIDGLDSLMEGGMPKGSCVMLAGGPGVGKTTICSQYIWQGMTEDEKCLIVSTEEPVRELQIEAERFGWGFDTSKDTLDIKYIDHAENVLSKIENINAKEYDRIAFDSISTVGMSLDNEKKFRLRVNQVIEELRGVDATILMTAEMAEESSGKISKRGIAEFVAQGVIKLDMTILGDEVERTASVRKMRATDLDVGEYSFVFTDEGIKLNTE